MSTQATLRGDDVKAGSAFLSVSLLLITGSGL